MLCTSIFDKKLRSEVNINEVLAQESDKPVVRKKNGKKKVYSMFKDNIWAVNFGEMVSLSSFNHGVKYLLYVRCFQQICLS